VVQEAISDDFVKEHYAGLHLLLRRRIGDAGVAAEILNEAVATAIAHLRLGRIAQPDRLPGYVYRVALNLYRNYRREFDNRAEIRVHPDDIDQLPASSPQENVDTVLLQRVRAIVEELPTARDREIVKRFYLDEQDKAEICAALGLSSLHFDKVVFRARQRMRVLLEAKGLQKADLLSLLVCCCTAAAIAGMASIRILA
jgi:RNA polymerase sigma-70 factor (ECF subfamily)